MFEQLIVRLLSPSDTHRSQRKKGEDIKTTLDIFLGEGVTGGDIEGM